MKTIKCAKCNAEIDKIEYKPYHYCVVNDCSCKEGALLMIPTDENISEIDIKCPECHDYPFAYPISEITKFTQVVIRNESAEDSIEKIL